MVAHLDPELVALLALGEPVGSGADEEHLASCAECRRELDRLREVVGVARSVPADARLVPPSPEVWERVRAQVAASPPGEPDVDGPTPGPRPPADGPRRPAPGREGTVADGGTVADITGPARGRRRRTGDRGAPGGRRTLLVGVAAALVGALVGLAGTLFVVADERSDAIARGELQPLGDSRARGTTTLATPPGGRQLVVEVDGLPNTDGYYEVWLLDPAGSRLVSLGVLAGDRGTFALPGGLDLATYPVVDVSREPLDGNPAHSKDSVLRGSLPT